MRSSSMLFCSGPGSRASTTGFEAGTAVERSVGAARRLSSRVTTASVLRAAQACSSNSTQRLFASGDHTCKTGAPAGKRCLRVRTTPAEVVDCRQGMGLSRSAWLPSRAQACPDLKKQKKMSPARYAFFTCKQSKFAGVGDGAAHARLDRGRGIPFPEAIPFTVVRRAPPCRQS